MNEKDLVKKVRKIVRKLIKNDKGKNKKIKTVPTGVRGSERKKAIEFSESKKIFEKIKNKSRGKDRDEALQNIVEDKNLTDKDVSELMYDLKQKLNMTNIERPEAKALDVNLLIDSVTNNLPDELFKVKVNYAIDKGNQDYELDFDEISVNLKKLLEQSKNVPDNISDKDLKNFAENLNTELVNYPLKNVDVYLGDDEDSKTKKDLILESLDIVGGKLENGTIRFKTKDLKYFVK